MENIGDDLGKQFQAFRQKVQERLKPLPTIVANEAKNFFVGRFKTQDWIDYRTEPWKRRKNNKYGNRAILTKTGALKRSIHVMNADWGHIEVGTDLPYAAIHNNGFRGIMRVGEHHRIASRKVATEELKLKGRQKYIRLGGRIEKIRGKGHQVKSHKRNVNMPKRRFIGQSHYLNIRLDRIIMQQLNNL